MTPNLSSLEVEVLAIILEYLDNESPGTTKSVALTCRHIYATSQLVLHRNKSLDISFALLNSSIERLTTWLNETIIIRGLRSLTIGGMESPGLTHEEISQWRAGLRTFWAHLVFLLEKSANLKDLVWSTNRPVPISVLDTLHQYQPKARLKVYQFSRHYPYKRSADEAEIALAKSPALALIRVCLRPLHSEPMWADETVDFDNPDPRLSVLGKIIATAPNLHTVSFLWRDHTSHHPHPEFVTDEQLRPNPSVRSLTIDKVDLSKSMLEYWARFIDLSTLEYLKLSSGTLHLDFFDLAPSTFRNLKKLSLNLITCTGEEWRTKVERYLTNCPALELLSLWSWMQIVSLDTILTHHGTSLRTLHLHEREVIDGEREVLNLLQIREIRQKCPQLQDFMFDINRCSYTLLPSEEQPNLEIFQELALFPKLDKLQIYFDLGIVNQLRPDIPPTLPFDSELPNPSTFSDIGAYVRLIWQVVHRDRTCGQRRLDVKFGDWERALSNPWLKTWWVLKPHERDDRRNGVLVQIHAAFKRSSGII